MTNQHALSTGSQSVCYLKIRDPRTMTSCDTELCSIVWSEEWSSGMLNAMQQHSLYILPIETCKFRINFIKSNHKCCKSSLSSCFFHCQTTTIYEYIHATGIDQAFKGRDSWHLLKIIRADEKNTGVI